MNTMDIKDIIKDLNHICEDIYELHNLLICKNIFENLNFYPKNWYFKIFK